MRKFSKDAPEFFAFQVEGDKKTYKIPVAGSMTNRQILEFQAIGEDYFKQVEWLRSFMGDAVDDLTASETGSIIKAWADASQEQGASAGES